MEECPVCSLRSVIVESENGSDVRVCTECGTIASETQELITTSVNTFEGTTSSDQKPTKLHPWMDAGDGKRDAPGLTEGKNVIKHIGTTLKFTDVMIQASTELYLQAYHRFLKQFGYENKWAMCLCCLFVVGRQNDYGLTIRDLSVFAFNIPRGDHKIGEMFKALRLGMNVEIPVGGQEVEIRRFLSQIDLPLELIRQTQTLVQLLQLSWIVTGRSKTLITIIAAYFVWQASDVVKNHKVTITAFCKRHKLAHTTTVNIRKKEIEAVLEELVKQLPWVSDNYSPRLRVLYHLKDILQFHRTLIHKAIQSVSKEIEKTSVSESSETHLLKEYGNFYPPCLKQTAESSLRPVDGGTDLDGSPVRKKLCTSWNGQKSHVSPGKGSNSDTESIELGSDDDTDLYIRTPQEVLQHEIMYSKANAGMIK